MPNIYDIGQRFRAELKKRCTNIHRWAPKNGLEPTQVYAVINHADEVIAAMKKELRRGGDELDYTEKEESCNK